MPLTPVPIPKITIEDVDTLLRLFDRVCNPPKPVPPPRKPDLWKQAFKEGSYRADGRYVIFGDERAPEKVYRRLDPEYVLQEKKARAAVEEETKEVQEKLDHLLICLRPAILAWSEMGSGGWRQYQEAVERPRLNWGAASAVTKDLRRIRAKLELHQQEVAAKAVRDALRVGAEQVKADLPGSTAAAGKNPAPKRRQNRRLLEVVAELWETACREKYSKLTHAQERLAARLHCSRGMVRNALGLGKERCPMIEALKEWSERPGSKARTTFYVHTESDLARTVIAREGGAGSFLDSFPAKFEDPTALMLDDEVDVHFEYLRSLSVKSGDGKNLKKLDKLTTEARRSLVAVYLKHKEYRHK